MIRNVSYVGIVAIFMTFLLMSKGLDLSCDSVAALTSILVAFALQYLNLSPILSIGLAVIVSAVIGLINSRLITAFRMPSFIVTLGMLYVAKGSALILSNGGYIMIKNRDYFLSLINKKYFGLTMDIYVFLVIAVGAEFVLRFTSIGRKIILLGTNSDAARISGINTVRIISILYILTSIGASLGAIEFTMRSSIGMIDCGTMWALQAITACVIGGTSIYGGKGSIIGTILGVIFLAEATNIMTLGNIHAEWQNVGLGLFIILGIFLEVFRTQRLK
jgi:ribose/xylose/arabinose/galactoside ABC-type transport system permease subunit